VFDYGIASRGKIYVSGSALVRGVNSPTEASVLSMRTEPVAIEAGGHATITGDLYVTGDNADYVLLSGNGLSIGGASDIEDILRNHVFLDVQGADFPEIDAAPFLPFVTGLIDSATNLVNGGTFTNVRVKAGTNPTFGNDTVINGVLYVEAPNTVTFGAKATVKGIIVTQDGSSLPPDSCQIDFKAQASAPGVGALPTTSEFAALRALSGTILLAPGFGVTFRGNSNSINGTIAADQISFNGDSSISGSINGVILGLKDTQMTLRGNTTIQISRPSSSHPPAGFKHPIGLYMDSASYSEPVGN